MPKPEFSALLRHYLTVVQRNFTKNPIFSALNAVGLSLGMAAFIFIFQYVGFEESVNRFHTNLPHLYRVLQETQRGEIWDYTPPVLGTDARRQFAEVENFCRVAEDPADGVVSSGEGSERQSIKEEHAVYADGSFFDLFSFSVTQGDAKKLKEPNTVAISESTAHKYFRDASCVGKVITLSNDFGNTPFSIVAVYQDFPANSDLQYTLVFSLQTLATTANLNGNDWANLEGTSSYLTTYLQLAPAADVESVAQKIDADRKKRYPASEESVHLQPLTNLHLARQPGDRYPSYGNIGFLYVLIGIALLIVAIAWLNYINLSTAGAMKRAKEVGIRKSLGAGKGQLVAQFLGESLLLNAVALIIALALVELLQAPFNAIVGKPLSLSSLAQNGMWLSTLAFILLGSFASGAYAAFALTAFKPIQTLKGIFVQSVRGVWLRQTLVVFQFTISIVLIAATLILFRQLRYMQTKDLGLDLNQLVVINGPEVGRDSTLQQRNESFLNQIATLPFVEKFCSTGSVPSKGYNFSTDGITRLAPRPGDEKLSYSIAEVDENFIPTYGLALVAGRNFLAADCRKKWSNRNRLMLNERAAAQLGFASAQQAVGQQVTWNSRTYEVVGVLKDYHHLNLREAISPVVYLPSTNNHQFSFKLKAVDMQSQIETLKAAYATYFPGNPFTFFFVDDNYNRQYQAEQQYGLIFTAASALAIFIACLGLFGLATFTTEQRVKEIGIRKILGASITQVTALLTRDFLFLVVAALLIATPLCWYAMSRWLEGFAYRTNVTWSVFGIAGATAVIIAFATVSTQAIRAALANPVDSLRSE